MLDWDFLFINLVTWDFLLSCFIPDTWWCLGLALEYENFLFEVVFIFSLQMMGFCFHYYFTECFNCINLDICLCSSSIFLESSYFEMLFYVHLMILCFLDLYFDFDNFLKEASWLKLSFFENHHHCVNYFQFLFIALY